AAHAADVQGGVGAEGVGECGDVLVVAHGEGDGGADVEAVKRPARLLPARAQVPDGGLLQVLGGGEDQQGPVGDLTGLFEVLRADRGDVQRDVLALRVHGELDRLA